MKIPAIIITILDRLQASGHEAYVVGGAVRDVCLDREPVDWDVATSARAERIRALFRDMRHFSLNEYTVTLVHSGRRYEVTSYRGPGKTGKTIQEDLGHRDFTINAMAYDVHTGKVIDPWGGRFDAIKKVVRAVGSPAERFLEDPLRLIRAARLATELKFRIDPETLGDMSRMARELVRVSRERIRDELTKVLMSERPSYGLRILARTGLLKFFLPELLEGYRKRQNLHHGHSIFMHIVETVDAVQPVLALRLSALFHDVGKPRVRKKVKKGYRFLDHDRVSADLTKEIMSRLRFSKDLTEEVSYLVSNHMIHYDSGWSDRAVRRFVARVGLESVGPLLALREADLIAHGKGDHGLKSLSELKKRLIKIHETAPPLKTRDLAINGHTVMKILGMEQGPEVGGVLKDIMEKVTEDPELNTRERLISILKKLKAHGEAGGKHGKP